MPVLTDNDFLQRRAFVEHIRHICDALCIQRAEVELGQTDAPGEHILHPGHLGGVQAGKINGFKSCPVPEHSLGAASQFYICFVFIRKNNTGDIVSVISDKVVIRKRQTPIFQSECACATAAVYRQHAILYCIIVIQAIIIRVGGFKQHFALGGRFAAFNGVPRRAEPAFNVELFGSVLIRQLIPAVAQAGGGCGIGADCRLFAGHDHVAFITADKPRSRSRGSMGLAVIVERGLPPCQTDFLLRDGIVHRKLIGATRYITNRNFCGVFARCGWSGHRSGTTLLIVGNRIPTARSGRCFESIFPFEGCFGRFAVIIDCLLRCFQRQHDLMVCQIAAINGTGRRQGLPVGGNGIGELMPMHHGIRAGKITRLTIFVDDSFGIIAGTRALRSVFADQLDAAGERIRAFRIVDIPIVADPDGDQIGAAREHLRQAALPRACIATEDAEVTLVQTDAPLEQLAHGLNFGCRQMGEVNRSKRLPVLEHSCRAFGQHSAGFKFDAFDRGFRICERRVPLFSREAAALYRQHTVVNGI